MELMWCLSDPQNGLFPALDDDIPPKPDFTIGPQTRKPYQPGSLFNISAMSYGSLSKPAIQALSRGAALSRCVCENPHIKMVEIKLSQGAKPGKGGILPGNKVTAEIAAIRGIEEGVSALSPNRHVDAGNAAELLDLIHRIREVSGLPTGIKLCIGQVSPVVDLLKTIKTRGDASAPA